MRGSKRSRIGIKGIELTAPVLYRQNGLQLAVDLRSGQKTGGYLDQRENHVAAARYLSGRRVLGCVLLHRWIWLGRGQGGGGFGGGDRFEPAGADGGPPGGRSKRD